jgi:tetratricopeptide (TPR) repeat protein
MSDPAEKARTLRLERLQTMLDKQLSQPPAALETLMSELRIGEAQPQLWEGLHAAAARDGKEQEMAAAYRKFAADRRLKQLPTDVHAEVLMHAADFFQGVLGDPAGSEGFLRNVLEMKPDHAEAYKRLERKYEAANDDLKLVELYALVAATPPKPADEMARRAIQIITLLPAKSPLSDEACKRLLALVPASASLLSILEAHCQKTERVGLACALLELGIAGPGLPDARIVDHRRRLVDLYLGPAKTPEKAMPHVEDLLSRDSSDARARAAANTLLSVREVASRAAAALQRARRQSQMPPSA